ncbi:HET-domain-containing protein [Thozetella sp. PMI_491]|nr:HET-domain-containing protein [Thozetella sp. PMI_491]
MRLLNSKSLEMKEFLPDAMIYKYAILSHRWGAEEISFQDVTSKHSDANAKKGYKKLKLCCQQAAKDGFEWVWIDTCCIDKSSSAELSEAINSMYQWYRNAKICYVYLADVTYRPFDFESTLEEFQTSEWFTRGWTLQELIAPSSMHFFAKDWTEIGTKRSLLKNIHTAAGVAKEVLEGEQVPAARSIAERMAWAADRKTSRPEDVAYCLLGIFQVNMPLMYGEGHRAFERLQQEILRQEEDYTILAWPTPTSGRNNFGQLNTRPCYEINLSSRWDRSGCTILVRAGDCVYKTGRAPL